MHTARNILGYTLIIGPWLAAGCFIAWKMWRERKALRAPADSWGVTWNGVNSLRYEDRAGTIIVDGEMLAGEPLSFEIYPTRMHLERRDGPALDDENRRALIAERCRVALETRGYSVHG